MKKRSVRRPPALSSKHFTLPIFVEQDEDGFYVIECPVLQGCYTQGKTLDEALHHIREVIELLREEEGVGATLRGYKPRSISFHTITV